MRRLLLEGQDLPEPAKTKELSLEETWKKCCKMWDEVDRLRENKEPSPRDSPCYASALLVEAHAAKLCTEALSLWLEAIVSCNGDILVSIDKDEYSRERYRFLEGQTQREFIRPNQRTVFTPIRVSELGTQVSMGGTTTVEPEARRAFEDMLLAIPGIREYMAQFSAENFPDDSNQETQSDESHPVPAGEEE